MSVGGLLAAPLRVGVAEAVPFLKSEDGIWSGLSIDLWEKVAGLNKWEYEYVTFPDADTALAAALQGKVDIVVAVAPITSDAVKGLDFSQPYFRSGLHIMIPEARQHSFGRLVEDLQTWGHLKVFWAIAALVLLMTVVVTVFERKHNPEFPKTWHEGLAEAFYYVISLALTGKSTYKGFPGVLGRLVLVGWMILGTVVVVYLTSTITATMTAEKFQAHISGPKDLPGKLVGAVKGSRAEKYLRTHSIEANIYPSIDEAAHAMLKEQVRAVVGAAPILQFYDFSHPTQPVTEVGPIFSPYNYGFALPQGSTFRSQVNADLLKFQEDGIVTELGQKYFGSVYQD